MSAKGKNLLQIGLAVVFLAAAALACGPTPGDGAVSVVLTSPGDGGTVVVGQAVMIDSAVTAAAGVDRVDLSVDGQMVRHDTPPEGNPTEFRVSQLWTPTSEGQATITVAAYDVNEASDEATITLQVVASGGVVPTSIPGATAVATESTETPPPPVTTEAGCTLDSQYVTDVTIPDGMVMSPSAAFVKTWRVRNSGTCDWEAGYELVFVSGAQMGGPGVPLPAVTAGGETDISVNLVAPSSYDTHKGTWRIRAVDGTMFGTNLTVVIAVVSPETGTPLPTGAPTIAPTDAPPVPTPVLIKPPSSTAPYTDRVTGEDALPGHGKKEIAVECPAGSVIVGGGFSGSPRVVFSKNHKTAGNGWTVDAKNTSDSSETIRVYAVCLHNAPGASSEMVLSEITVESHDRGTVTAHCPSGSIASGGGWVTHENVRLSRSARDGSLAWSVVAVNNGSTPYPLSAVAICLSGVAHRTDGAFVSAEVPSGGSGQTAIACPPGNIMTSGGFSDNWDNSLVIHINSGPWGTEPDAEWRVYASNITGTDTYFYAFATCLVLP